MPSWAIWVIIAAALGTTCTSSVPQPVARAQPAPRRFDPDSVRAPAGSPVARVRALLDAEDSRALRVAEAALPSASRPRAGRLRWLAASAARASGRHGAERRHLDFLSRSQHPLARYASVRFARLLERRDPERGLERLRAIGGAWPGATGARALEARLLLATGATAEAIAQMRELFAQAPQLTDTGMRLAGLLASRSDPAAREEAARIYQRVATTAPLTDAGARAAERANALTSRSTALRRGAWSSGESDVAWARGQALFRVMRHREAERGLRELVQHLSAGPRRCEAMLLQGRAIDRQRQRRRAATHMAVVARQCRDGDVHAWALFFAARGASRLNRRAQAIALFDELVRAAPTHRLADDALYRAALLSGEAGDADDLRRRLRLVVERYPDADKAGEARFQLAWHARAEAARARATGDDAIEPLRRALRHFEAAIVEAGDEHVEGMHGRAAYFRARTLADLGHTVEAAAGYERVAMDHPLTYYAQQAVARLREVDVARAQRILGRWRRPDTPLPALSFDRLPELDTPGFARARELLVVGEVEAAEQELRMLGLLGRDARADARQLGVALLDRAGAHARASRLARRQLRRLLREPPVGRAYHLWRMAYPNAFSPLIETVARGESVPPAFVRAVAREESAFDARAVSIAHAYGLIQLIAPTARRYANELGLASNRRALMDPETNLRIGTRFIAHLRDRFATNPAVVPAAYNAGEFAVERWLRERPGQPLDEWVESIPYAETRRYTRRVLQTYGIYHWLDTQTLPDLRAQVGSPP